MFLQKCKNFKIKNKICYFFLKIAHKKMNIYKKLKYKILIIKVKKNLANLIINNYKIINANKNYKILKKMI